MSGLARLERRAPWVAAFIALSAGLATMTSDPVGGFNDDGIYLLTAKALATGQGYVYPHLPGTPPAIHYPPVWSALLAAVWKLAPPFPGNSAWLKLINPVVLAAAAAGCVAMGRTLFRLPWWVAFGGVVAATLTVPMLLMTNLLLSEPLFLALLVPTLLVTERAVREGGWRTTAAAAALVSLLVLTRTLGGVVLVAGSLLLLRERRWQALAVFVLVAVLLLLPWQLFVWRAASTFPDELRGSYGPYLEWVIDGFRDGGWTFYRGVLAKNVEATWAMVGIFVSAFPHSPARHLLAAIAVGFFVAGMTALGRRTQAPVTVLALAGYLVVVLSWPFWVDRFLWVLWPLLMLIALVGATVVIAALRDRHRDRAAYALVGALLLVAAGHETYNARGLARGWASSASHTMTGAGIRIIRQVNDDRSLDGKLLAAELAPMVALYTGARVLPVEILTTGEHLVDKLPAQRTNELQRIDRRFRPDAYVVMGAGPYYPALLAARLDGGRTLSDLSPPGAAVRTLKVSNP